MYDKNENYAYFTSVYKNNKPKLLSYLNANHFLGDFYKERKQKIHLMWRPCQSVWDIVLVTKPFVGISLQKAVGQM
jgi:hypothetical protein